MASPSGKCVASLFLDMSLVKCSPPQLRFCLGCSVDCDDAPCKQVYQMNHNTSLSQPPLRCSPHLQLFYVLLRFFSSKNTTNIAWKKNACMQKLNNETVLLIKYFFLEINVISPELSKQRQRERDR